MAAADATDDQEFSWADVGVVTIRDRSAEVSANTEELSECSTSESDVEQEFIDLQKEGHEPAVSDGLQLSDLFPSESLRYAVEADEIALPSVEEARAQIDKLKARRQHILEIAQRYSGAQRVQSRSRTKVLNEVPPQQELQEAQSALKGPRSSELENPRQWPAPGCGGVSLDLLRQTGIDVDGVKLQAGLASEAAKREELWMSFLCGDDKPVGGDALPSPDEFLHLRGGYR